MVLLPSAAPALGKPTAGKQAVLTTAHAGIVAQPSATSTAGLPDFAGWQKIQTTTESTAPWGLSSNQAELLGECRLVSVERARYRRGVRLIDVKGYRFQDASGAYGGYTLLRPPTYHRFTTGSPTAIGVSGDTHVVLMRGPWVILVNLDQLTAMTGSEMRQLLKGLNVPQSPANQPPTLPLFLPPAGLVHHSMVYAGGPTSLAAAAPWFPVSAAGFDKGVEIVTGLYDLNGASRGKLDICAQPTTPASLAPSAVCGQVVLLSYPTPDIARNKLAQLRQQLAGARLIDPSLIRRSGPFVSLFHFGAPSGDRDAARQVLSNINWDATVTWTRPMPIGAGAVPQLLIGIFLLVGLLIAVAVVVGLLTGGLRAFLARLFPKRFGKKDEDNIIRLEL